ncbi:conserved hypothetical protein [Vibrio crassostreae]|uniref:hypothetical protein n=1 Tax=Vibrio sp. AIC-3 TaxID=2607604 RepID=UPI00127E4AE5|nr:hypothetical protein [Vibrio sp. AIC-3]KAA8596263.1 hypothetical protein F0Z19_4988 [Vibrio cyclitrophicus]CAH6869128.1 conserved hypothetical protein [Vibrio chagasii]CAK2465360.1 conserved hypothetical protein [Vibrio crassostreae]NOH94572.1 hypothetical protein [Vibrio sp. AIC-3]CAH7147596.1 conserved hypothetical protein [Vibrio chagasii]
MKVSDPIHLPCPDMAGMENPDPKKLQRSQVFLQKLREKHGIKKPVKRKPRPMNYQCTESACAGW